jgi:hypothetical protein
VNEYGYELPPLPTCSSARFGDERRTARAHRLDAVRIRWPEELIMKALFLYHPLLRNEGILYDGSVERRPQLHARGGDVHTLARISS